jgi:hypothetical protein
MSTTFPITRDYFIKRFATLCARSGLKGFPKDEVDQHILYKSAVLTLDPSATYSEKEINQRLESWITEISQMEDIDRITLRRYMVDSGYLLRASDGSSYHVVADAPRAGYFAADVVGIDLCQVLDDARAEIERRKREYMQKSGKG